MPKVAQRSWWWEHYHDHPSFLSGQGGTEGFAGTVSSGKHKIYCKRCLDSHVASLSAEDAAAVILGRRALARTQGQIESHLWDLKAESNQLRHGWISSATSTAINHLRVCSLVSEAVRSTAHEERSRKYGPNSPTSQRRRRDLHVETTLDMLPPRMPSISLNSPDPPAPIAGPSRLPDYTPLSQHYEQWGGPSSVPSPSLHYASLRNSPAPSDSGSSYSNSRPSARSTSLRRVSSRQSIPIDPALYWPREKQNNFEVKIARLTASAGFPLSWVDNPEWIDFCTEFLPAAKLPSRKTLTRRLLPAAIAELRASARAAAKGHEATLQADGWTGINNHHLLAFMITADGKIYTVKVDDTSEERKTAEKLLVHLEAAKKEVEEKWGAVVVAIVTDASGECRKARRILGLKYPSLVVLDCYAHQINLVVGKYFKSNAGVLKYADKATQLIAWLRSKTLILAMLRKVRAAANLSPLSVIRAVLTRWTAHYMAYRRLLELRRTLESVIANDAMQSSDADKTVVTGDAKAKQKSRQMVKVIQDPLFWHSLTRMKRHLEPLAIATNVTQASFCRLDQVLMTFGHLIMQYKSMMDPEDMVGCTAIIESIEARWATADQEIFIAAVVLNPFYQSTPFAALQFLTNAGIQSMLGRLWQRFFQTEPPPELYQQITGYLRGTDLFKDLKSACAIAQVAAQRESQTPDPMAVYEDFCFPGRERPAFIRLAMRILSISANSASCERLFSMFGNILTKLRNRLGTENMNMLAELKMHIRDEHAHKETKKRLKRVFQVRTDAERAAATLAVPPVSIDATPSQSSANTTSDSRSPQSMSVDETTNSSEESETSEDENTTEGSPRPRTSRNSNSFRSIVERQSELVDEDETDCAPVRQSSIGLTPIRSLFDFSRTHWVEMYSKSSIRSFDEELELYEMLDLDADGEEDVDVNVDEDTGDILMG